MLVGAMTSVMPRCAATGANCSCSDVQQLHDIELGELGAHTTGVQARDVQQVFEQFAGSGQRIVDALGEPAQIAVRRRAAAQRRIEQACGSERLQQVVARRHDETRLRLIGELSLRHRGRELARAFFDTQLQCLVDFAQALCGALVAGDVAECGDETAVRQRLAAQLDDAPIRAASLRGLGGTRAHVRDALAGVLRRIARAAPTPFRVVADQLFDGLAGEHEARRVFEKIEVALIPRHQAHLGVHHADALRQVVHHGFEQFAIEAQFARRLVEQGDDFREFDSRRHAARW